MGRMVAEPPDTGRAAEPVGEITGAAGPRPSVWTRPLGALTLLGLALLMALFMSQVVDLVAAGKAPDQREVSHLREGGDSYQHWFALQALREGRDPYGRDVTRRTQLAIWGKALPDHVMAFVYPLPSLLWYLPMLWLDLPAAVGYARGLGLVGLLVALVAGMRFLNLRLSGWPLIAAVGLLGSLGGVYDQYALGQNASLALALALGSVLLYQSGRYGLAGVVLSLALVKPQYVLVLGLGLGLHALGARERWRFLAGCGLGIALPVALSVLLVPNWIVQWLTRLSSYNADTATYLQVMVGDSPLATWAARILICAPVLVFWWRHRREPPTGDWWRLAVAAGLASGTVALTPNTGLYNLLLVWPALALLLLAPARRPSGIVARLIVAFNQVFAVAVPGAAGLIALVQPLASPGAAPILARVATLLIWLGLWQGMLITAWLLMRTLPAAWRSRPAVGAAARG